MSKSGGIDPLVPPVPTALTWSHPFNEEFGINHEAKNILCHILGHLLISNHHPTSSFLNFFDLGDPWFWLDFLVCFCLPNRLHKNTQILQMFLLFSSLDFTFSTHSIPIIKGFIVSNFLSFLLKINNNPWGVLIILSAQVFLHQGK